MKSSALIAVLKKFFSYFSHNKSIFIPAYRIVEIMRDEESDNYIVKIQMINKNTTFNITPEEILAKNEVVDRFSPRDVRTLTYLGYLGINSPKYKILAKRLSENNEKIIFALKKKGNKKIIVKTINELIKEKDIIENLGAKDAHLVGYAFASESAKEEKQQKEDAIKGFVKSEK